MECQSGLDYARCYPLRGLEMGCQVCPAVWLVITPVDCLLPPLSKHNNVLEIQETVKPKPNLKAKKHLWMDVAPVVLYKRDGLQGGVTYGASYCVQLMYSKIIEAWALGKAIIPVCRSMYSVHPHTNTQQTPDY